MRLIPSILVFGTVFSAVQVIIGADIFLRGRLYIWEHIGIAVLLVILLLGTFFMVRREKVMRRHIVITLTVLLLQGSFGLDMFAREVSSLTQILHWILGFATVGSFIGALFVSRRRPSV